MIKDIKVQEKIRDLEGRATRAVVDISFIQVPKYQVESGRDIASKTLTGSEGPFAKLGKSLESRVREAVDKNLIKDRAKQR